MAHLAAPAPVRGSCEWASWFRAQHEGSSWSRVPSDFEQTGWLMDHTGLLNELRLFWERWGYSVLTEGQNSFTLVQSWYGRGAAI